MKRQDFLKSLFGLGLIPLIPKFDVTEIKPTKEVPKEIQKLKSFHQVSGSDYIGMSSDHISYSDFEVTGKKIKDIKIQGDIVAIKFNNEMHEVTPITLRYFKES